MVAPELHDRLPWTPHVQNLDVGSVHVESRHVVRIGGVEGYAQQRRRGRSRRRRRRGRRRRDILRRRRLVEYSRVFQTPQIKGSQAAVCANRDEDVRGPRQPRDVVDLPVMRNELRNRGRRVDVPHGARCVYRRGHD